MGITDTVTKKLIQHAAAGQGVAGMSWPQTIDFACSMLGISARHIRIDSSRAVVHVSYTQLGTPHVLDIPFNDIVQGVNGSTEEPVTSHPKPPTTVRIGEPRSWSTGGSTSPP